jgi:hypothetical protein
MYDNTGIHFRSNAKTLCDHFNACPSYWFEKACNICSPAGSVDGIPCGVIVQRVCAVKIMKAFVHNFDVISYVREPVKSCGKGDAVKAERRDGKHG